MQKNTRAGKNIGGAGANPLLAQAVSAFQASELAEARRLCALIVETDRKNAVALHLFGVIEALQHDAANALHLFDRALKIDPRNANIFADKGKVLSELGQHHDALVCYRRAISINPKHGIALYNQACSLLAVDQPADALALFDRLIQLAPNHAPAYHGRAIALTDLRRFDDAIASSEQALKLQPEYAEALQSRGLAHTALRRHDLALVDFKNAARLNSDLENLQASLVWARMFCCDWDLIERDKSDLVSAARSGRTVAPFTFLAVAESPQDQLVCCQTYAAKKYPPIMPPLWRGQKYNHEKIRVAYVSADFHEHPTAFLMAGLFEEHDRSRFEITAVAIGRDDASDVRNRIRSSVTRFIDARAMDEPRIAATLRQQETDILVDVDGYTEANRFRIFSYKAAPLQVSYLGFPGTTGATYIDYIIADRIVVRADQREFYSEKIAFLPHSYQINDAKRSIADRMFTRTELGLPEAGFVFCCFNGNYKITPRVFDSWMRILKRVEGSVLWLFENNPAVASNLKKEAAARDVDPHRLIFAKQLPLAEHLARHRSADLFLDTLPYNAHTTASDALWTGLPVVTCVGDTFPGKVAASLLNAIGLPELTTTTVEAYEALAVDLATQPKKLAAIRNTLMANRLTTPLFDTKLSTRHIEAAFVAMHERYQAGLPPDHIVIPN